MDTEIIKGTVTDVVYESGSSGYSVLRVSDSGGASVTLVGCIPKPVPGETVEARGRWVTHPSFGRQFEVDSGGCERTMPADKSALLVFLKSGAVPGIGMATAKALLDRFGDSVLEIIEREPKRLAEVRGISAKRAEAIGRAFKEQNGVRRVIELLTAHGLSPHHALKLYKLYGPDAMTALTNDPYLLARPPFDADFAAADRMALSLGQPRDGQTRLKAAVLFELSYNLDNGHCFIPYHKLVGASEQLLRLPGASFEEAIDGLADDGDLINERVGGKNACYLTSMYMAECNVATRIQQITALPPEAPPGLTALLERAERSQGVTLEPEQRQAVLVAAKTRLFILTGGPGTGKTTTVRAIVDFFGLSGLKVALAAPTGRAAKRLGEVCGSEAYTVHRLLGVSPDPVTGEMGFSYNSEHPLPYDVIVVDEASMVDIPLMDALTDALDLRSRLILVGDRDQLPSVGPGCVLSDLLDSGCVESVTLNRVFRQAAKSRIVTCAHAVNNGEHPEIDNKGDLYWMTRPRPEQAVETVVELCTRRLPENMGIPASSIQVLTPTRRGAAGSNNLNEALQRAVNPPDASKHEHRHGHTVFREGDRVMQIRNNYDMVWYSEQDGGADDSGTGVFNGDIGLVESVDTRGECLTVRFEDGRAARYAFEQLSELELAYAMTVHKSQGSEYRAVVLAMLPCASGLMTRSVLYTAMTRARELLVMVGDRDVVNAMVDNGRRSARYGALKNRLAE